MAFLLLFAASITIYFGGDARSISQKLTNLMGMCTSMLQKMKTCNDINYLG